MDNDQFTELSARCEALARVVLNLGVVLEEDGVIDGHRLQEHLFGTLPPQGTPAMDRTAELLQELSAKYSAARSARRATALWSKNRPNQNDQ